MAVTGGFGGRRPDRGAPQDRVPPGQYVTRDFPVLTAGPTQRTRLENWSLELHGGVDPLARWNWAEFEALPQAVHTVDIHGVTKWTKLDTRWRGVTFSDGEVSPFLTQELMVGDSMELRGPIGCYFTWQPELWAPLMLIAGGSSVIPLMSMLRTRYRARDAVPARLLYSSRTVEDIVYRQEIDRLVADDDKFSLIHTITRGAPAFTITASSTPRRGAAET